MVSNGDGAVRPDQTSDIQLIVNTAPSLIQTGTTDGYLDFFNQTWLRYVRRALEDSQGWKLTAFIHPEDVEGIVVKSRGSPASGEPFLHGARVLRADGEYRWMLHHNVAVRDHCDQVVKWHGMGHERDDGKGGHRRCMIFAATAETIT
jgi:PAS domain-containing protein